MIKELRSIPDKSILGINYSGMHDSALAIVTNEGDLHFAVSLERISRVKQDGRQLTDFFSEIPWERISKVAVSAPENLSSPSSRDSKLLSTQLKEKRFADTLKHGPDFLDALNKIPCEKVFVDHQDAHAASAFWGSGFDEALCLTYDGGMSNDIWFGGLYRCSRSSGIQALDQFDALHYAKITTLYTFCTALLGFMPMRHEGKITGLAAYGVPTTACMDLLKYWFEEDYSGIEKTMYWINTYSDKAIPMLVPSDSQLESYRAQIVGLRREDLAAAVQSFAENHIIGIINRASAQGWRSPNICLAGGLFANVKINQRVAECGFDRIFVAPPMTDDGTALGAAWHLASHSSKRFNPKTLHSMFCGPSFTNDELREYLRYKGISWKDCINPAAECAELLESGQILAVFQGNAEFGPRALGNRSILAQATLSDINYSLNERLNRTEFMPFAPMTRVEDANYCYHDIDRVAHSAEFMTVTVNCTDIMKELCPAVVHVDGTARPQLVSRNSHPFIHSLLTEYKNRTGRPAIVNTSFNVHEEPIVCNLEDALRGFFESGLDYLYVGGVGLVAYEENKASAINYLREKFKSKSQKEVLQASLIEYLDKALKERTEWLEQAGNDLIERTQDLVQTRETLIDRTLRLEKAEAELGRIKRS